MAVYYINLLLILALAWPLCIYKPSKAKNLTYLLITFAYMWFLATFRYGIGYDYAEYIRIFDVTRQVPLAFPDMSDTGYAFGSAPWREEFFANWQFWQAGGNKYPGFVLFNKLINPLVPNSTVLYGIYELLILAPVVWFIYRHCKDVWLSTWLFVTLTFFYTSMNFTRQSIATSIILLGYTFLRDRKPVPFLLIVLIASTFHVTALILVPVYFICNLRLTPKLGIVYGALTLAAFVTSKQLVDLATEYIPLFAPYKDSIYLMYGLPMVFLLVPFCLFGGCLALKPLWEKRDPASTLLLNLMLYSAVIWLFIVNHFILERFSMYTYVFALVAVPSAIRSLQAGPEVHESLAALHAEEASSKKKLGKEHHAKVKALKQTISDHQKYYWSAVAAVILLTAVYNDFGANVNNFHDVFPYQSVLPWMNF